MRVKKIPMRKCIACQENKPKKDLVRIVNNADQGVTVDPTGKLNGRGAYLCVDSKCLARVQKGNQLRHALKTEIPSSVYEELKDYVESRTEEE